MSHNQFEAILYAMSFTKDEAALYVDTFWHVWRLIGAWNENMNEKFQPGWITCLDESMLTWTNKFTCAGFMFVPQKPWPFGNEYHTICCGLSSILFSLELVEGKDALHQTPPKVYDVFGKTIGLLMQLTHSMWHTGHVVVLDSGFCVLQGIVELCKKGVFAAAQIKKQHYWPMYIPGEAIVLHFATKDVGHNDALQ